MTTEKFDNILNKRLEAIKEVLAVKAKEYVRNEDRLHNFNVGARMENKHPAEILHGMMMKHWISYNDLVNDAAKGKAIKSTVMEEKIGDLINYLILQECIFNEYIDNLKRGEVSEKSK